MTGLKLSQQYVDSATALGRRGVGILTWLGLHELGVLLSVLAVCGGLWAFMELADDVGEGETRGFDRFIMLAMRSDSDSGDPLGPEWLEEAARDVTALGSVSVLALLTICVALLLALQARVRMMLLVIVAIGGGQLLNLALKGFFERPRPDLVPAITKTFTSSFPSGHAMVAATTYLTLAALLARAQSQRRIKAFFLLVAVVVSVLVGLTRVYLGVHYPTDVMAGWAVGAAWASLCWLAARWLQLHGGVEQERNGRSSKAA